jgi:hypothetical protein
MTPARIAEAGEASDITPRKLEQILKKLSGGARNPVMRYLRAVFNYGLKRGYLSENPINRLDFVPRPRREIEIIPNNQAIKMLNHALLEDLALLPISYWVSSAEFDQTASSRK